MALILQFILGKIFILIKFIVLKINKTILTVFTLFSLIILMDYLHVSNDEMRIIHKENLEKSKLGKTNNLDKKKERFGASSKSVL